MGGSMGKSNRSTKPQAALPLGTGFFTSKLRTSPETLRGTAVAVGVGVGVGVWLGVAVLVAVGTAVCVGVADGVAVGKGVLAVTGVASLPAFVQAASSRQRMAARPIIPFPIARCFFR